MLKISKALTLALPLFVASSVKVEVTATCTYPCQQGWDILRNGSLLVFSASSEDAGSYYCTGWITGTPLNSSIFEITVTAGGEL